MMGSPLVQGDRLVHMVRVQIGWRYGYTHASAFPRQFLQVSGRDLAVIKSVVEQCVKLLQFALWHFKSPSGRDADNAAEEQAFRRLCSSHPTRHGSIYTGRKLSRPGIAIHVHPMPAPPGV